MRRRSASPAAAVLAALIALGVSAPAVADPLGELTGAVNGVVDGVQGSVDEVGGAVGESAPGPVGEATQDAVGTGQDVIDGAQRSLGSPGGGSGGGSAAPGGSAGGSSGTGQAGAGSGGGGNPPGGSGAGRGDSSTGAGGRRDRGGRGRRGDGPRGESGSDPGARAGTDSGRPDGDRAASSGSNSDGFITRTVREIEEVIPRTLKIVIAILALLAAAFAVWSFLLGGKARRLTRQREQLTEDVGALQRALLPDVPERVGALLTSVAYRPADGPAAGGDFYDVFELEDGRVAMIVGDVAGHGRAALSGSASMRYTLRAYVQGGLPPRAALKLAARTLGESDAFVTVALAIHDEHAGTLTYAMAGHPPPVLLGSAAHEPITACSSPPVGAGLPVGQRQTTVPFHDGALACFFTDGFIEARTSHGLLGQDRFAKIVDQLGREASARTVLDRVLEETGEPNDDMAACVLRATTAGSGGARVEELELVPSDMDAPAVELFLSACGCDDSEATSALMAARGVAAASGAALLRVAIAPEGRQIQVGPVREPRLDPDVAAQAEPLSTRY
jgi:Stage II sporulation protein E (SpoIIE)